MPGFTDARVLFKGIQTNEGAITNTRYSISQTRNNFSQLVREAESGAMVQVTRRGKRVAVVISRRQYERFIARTRSFSEAWSEFTRDVSLAELQIDPDDVFGHVRSSEPGRNISFHEPVGGAGARS